MCSLGKTSGPLGWDRELRAPCTRESGSRKKEGSRDEQAIIDTREAWERTWSDAV
jgi:hypothetical protein